MMRTVVQIIPAAMPAHVNVMKDTCACVQLVQNGDIVSGKRRMLMRRPGSKYLACSRSGLVNRMLQHAQMKYLRRAQCIRLLLGCYWDRCSERFRNIVPKGEINRTRDLLIIFDFGFVGLKRQRARLSLGILRYSFSQVYHASPLPLVHKKELSEKPSLTLVEPRSAVQDYFAVQTNGQFQAQLIRVLATQFFYAITHSNAAEGARRIGNLFHTLSDSFSASHIERTATEVAVDANVPVCEAMTLERAFSMDTMNFLMHVIADFRKTDLAYKCAIFFQEQVLKLWAHARASFRADESERRDLAALNRWLDRL
eukprot:1951900-Amphidinium_carterae.1